jgi:hypothetical protein
LPNAFSQVWVLIFVDSSTPNFFVGIAPVFGVHDLHSFVYSSDLCGSYTLIAGMVLKIAEQLGKMLGILL